MQDPTQKQTDETNQQGQLVRQEMVKDLRPALQVLRHFKALGLFEIASVDHVVIDREQRRLAWKYDAETTQHMRELLNHMWEKDVSETGDGLSNEELARVLNTALRVLSALLKLNGEKQFTPTRPTFAAAAAFYGLDSAETMRDLNFNVLGKLKETLKWARYGATPSENPDDWFM